MLVDHVSGKSYEIMSVFENYLAALCWDLTELYRQVYGQNLDTGELDMVPLHEFFKYRLVDPFFQVIKNYEMFFLHNG